MDRKEGWCVCVCVCVGGYDKDAGSMTRGERDKLLIITGDAGCGAIWFLSTSVTEFWAKTPHAVWLLEEMFQILMLHCGRITLLIIGSDYCPLHSCFFFVLFF